MALERTFSIIKPDATRRNLTGQINARFEGAGLRIVAQKRKQLKRDAPAPPTAAAGAGARTGERPKKARS